jgi:hypothetical protein
MLFEQEPNADLKTKPGELRNRMERPLNKKLIYAFKV